MPSTKALSGVAKSLNKASVGKVNGEAHIDKVVEPRPAKLEQSHASRPASCSPKTAKKSVPNTTKDTPEVPQSNDILGICSQPKVKGLSNLGNTCFFNSVMQNLCQTPALVCLLREQCETKRRRTFLPIGPDASTKGLKPLDTVLEPPKEMTEALNSFFDEMATSVQATVRPSSLFDEIAKKAPRFRGFRQQDSHELLRHLIEGVYNEESKRQKKAVLEGLGMSVKTDPKSVSPELKAKVQAYKPDAQHTLLDTVFGGLILNTILCDECKKASQHIEPFMDLSLPLGEFRQHRPSGGGSGGPKKLSKHQQKKEARMKRREAKRKVVTKLKAVKDKENNDRPKEGVGSGREGSGGSGREGSDGMKDGDGDDAASVDDVSSVNGDGDVSSGGESDADVEDNDDIMNVLAKDVNELDLNTASRGGSSDEDEDRDDDNKEGPQLDEHTRRYLRQWIEKSLATLAAPKSTIVGYTLLSCLSHYTAPELLTGANKFRCDNCSKKRDERGKGGKLEPVYTNAQMRALILLPPAVLTLHLKRFQQTDLGLKKVSRKVLFPMILDLAPFCSAACLNITPNQTSVLYALYGVVEHHGSLQGGHYTAFVKTRQRDAEKIGKFLNRHPVRMSLNDLIVAMSNRMRLKSESSQEECLDAETAAQKAEAGGKWYHVSDSCVRPSSEASALGAEAYLLFYERIL